MAKFNADHKKEMTSNYFEEGVHKVKIAIVSFDKTDAGKEFAEFHVVGENGEEGSARVWFTTDKATNFAFNVIRGIFVHNAPKDKKDSIREVVDKVEDTDQLAELCTKLIGKECWYSVYKNTERPYQDADGNTKYNYDRNVYGYEPKPKTVSSTPNGSVTPVQDDVPFQPGEAANEMADF